MPASPLRLPGICLRPPPHRQCLPMFGSRQVLARGLEPPPRNRDMALNHARLPVPPREQDVGHRCQYIIDRSTIKLRSPVPITATTRQSRSTSVTDTGHEALGAALSK